jgi:hypothetical protein
VSAEALGSLLAAHEQVDKKREAMRLFQKPGSAGRGRETALMPLVAAHGRKVENERGDAHLE